MRRRNCNHEDHPDNHCCTDSVFNHLCDQDPEYERRMLEARKRIYKRAQEIKEERERGEGS